MSEKREPDQIALASQWRMDLWNVVEQVGLKVAKAELVEIECRVNQASDMLADNWGGDGAQHLFMMNRSRMQKKLGRILNE